MFAGLAEKAWGGADEKAAEAAYELAWEELHAGPRHSVPPVWRDAFALSCLSLASCHHRANQPVEALKVLDLGRILGGSRFRTELDISINNISSGTGIATSNGVHQNGSHQQLVLPDLQALHLRKKKEGSMLQEVNSMSFY